MNDDEFFLQQSVAKAELRIQQERAKLIDFIIVNLHSPTVNVCIADPASFILEKHSTDATFNEQICLMRQLDSKYSDFWNSLSTLIQQDQQSSNVYEEIRDKIRQTISKKSFSELEEIFTATRDRLTKDEQVDYDFWEFVSCATKCLLLKHKINSTLKASSNGIPQDSFAKSLKNQCKTLSSSIPKKLSQSFVDNSQQARKMYNRESGQRLNDDEQLLTIEDDPSEQGIKPRFYSKVRAIYEWNKYNQTHYDVDNPPPKTIVGYEFHIFYPLLAQSTTSTPHFKIIKKDFNNYLLKFIAGEPYRDISFPIVSGDWDTSGKHGFRSQFDDGVLFLKFNLKRNNLR